MPLAISPVVVGLALLLVYGGRDGWFGPALEDAGIEIIFATPGIILATMFVSLPLVIREVVPVLEEVGTDQEQAAHSLGASAVQTFRRITLPAIRWAIVYGVVLSLARSLGEFGAVQRRVGQHRTARRRPPRCSSTRSYQNFERPSAYAVSFLLAAVSVVCIVVVSFIRPDQSEPVAGGSRRTQSTP